MTPEEVKAKRKALLARRKALLDKAAEGKHKTCIKCRRQKPLIEFTLAGQEGNRQDYCKVCKTELSKERRKRDPRHRLRHIFAVRVRTHLGRLCPEGVDGSIDRLVGYNMQFATRHLQSDLDRRAPGTTLRDALDSGQWHIDHIRPLASHRIVTDDGVDWEEFRKAWHFSNLQMLSAEENLKKGARWDG